MGGRVNLTAVRTEYATLARDVVAKNVSVVDSLPDSVAPPAVLIGWGDPWLVQDTLCGWVANVEMMIVAIRIEPGGQYETIEKLIALLADELRAKRKVVRDITSPYPLTLGGLDYLSASINITHEVLE